MAGVEHGPVMQQPEPDRSRLAFRLGVASPRCIDGQLIHSRQGFVNLMSE